MTYLTCGNNGVIISSNYEDARRCQQYLPGGSIKKYSLFKDAEAAALAHLESILPLGVTLPEQIEFNEMVTIARLRRAQKGGDMACVSKSKP